jgi:hypothetical protein
VAGSCECGDEPSVSIKCREFLEKLRTLASQEGLCPMKLVLEQDSPHHLLCHKTKCLRIFMSQFNRRCLYWVSTKVNWQGQPYNLATSFPWHDTICHGNSLAQGALSLGHLVSLTVYQMISSSGGTWRIMFWFNCQPLCPNLEDKSCSG